MNKKLSILLTAVAVAALTTLAPQPFGSVSVAQAEEASLSKTTRPSTWGTTIYRGIVTSLEKTEDGLVVTLQQYKGSDYGAPSLEFLIGDDASLSFDRDTLKNGDYLEIYYGRDLDHADPKEVYPAISVQQCLSPEMVNFNGTFVAFEPKEGDKDAGRLVMTDLENGQEVVFNYSPAYTKLFVDLKSLQPGDALNIFHKGIYTMSLPPQGIPLEIRPMNPHEADTASVFVGTISTVQGQSATVKVDENWEIHRSADAVSLDLQTATTPLKPGDRVRVTYDGTVQETYPAKVQALSIEKLKG